MTDIIKDASNPKALVNLTPTVVSSRITAIPDSVLSMDEEALVKAGNIHDTERKMRAAWAIEYERACRCEEQMQMDNIYRGVVTHSYFHRYIVGNSYKLAYVIKPFPEYQAQLEDMLQLAMDEMRKILIQPMVNDKGEFDHKLASLKAQIAEKLQDRRRGPVIQRQQIEQKNLNLNLTKDVTQAIPENMEAINARIRELEGKTMAIEHKDAADAEREV